MIDNHHCNTDGMINRQYSLRGMLKTVGFAAIYFAIIGVGLRGARPDLAVPALVAGHAAIGLATCYHYLDGKRALRKSAPRYLDLPMDFPRWFFVPFGVVLFACVVLVELDHLPPMTLLVAAPMTMGTYFLFLPVRAASLCSDGVVFMGHLYPWDRIHPLRNPHGELEFLRFGRMRGAWRAIVPPALLEPVEVILHRHALQESDDDVAKRPSVPECTA